MGRLKEIIEGWGNYIFPNERIEKIAHVRAEICSKCNYNNNNTCSQCGCSLEKKTRSETSQCPEKKW